MKIDKNEIKITKEVKPKKLVELEFKVNSKNFNLEFLKSKYKSAYNADLIEDTATKLIFKGTEYKITVNKI
jgi:ribosomal 50S subunit-recycling heat shock protein